MAHWLKSALSHGLTLGVTGLLLGVVAGWVGLLAANGAQAVAGVVATLYPLLALALPAMLLLISRYRPVTPAILLLAGIFGFVFAHFMFLVPATNLPSVFGGENPAELSRALTQAVGWIRPAVTGTATVLSAAILAVRARSA